MERKKASAVLLASASNIPDEIRGDVMEVNRRMFGLSPREVDVKYIFEVWNRYVAPAGHPQDISCHNCRYKVLKSIRLICEAWEEKEGGER